MDIPSFEDLVKQIKINFWMIGTPFNDSKIYFRFYFLMINLILMIIEEAGFLFAKYSPDNLLKITELTPCTCIGTLSVLKMISIACKRQKIFELTKALDDLYTKNLNKNAAKQLIRNKIVIMKSLIKYYFILNLILVSVYNFSSLIVIAYTYFKSNKIVFALSYAVLVPFPVDNWTTWCLLFFHSIVCGYICVLYFTTVDAVYYVLTLHICNNFALLSNDIKYLYKNTQKLREIVIRHQHILKLSEDLEEIFRLPNLFNVLIGSVEICALGFNLTMGDWTQFPGCSLFLISVLLQILLMSIFGENLIFESRQIGEMAYLNKWYDMDEKSKKFLLIIMKRSHKHQRLTAYKFSTICYESFTKIISTSWSYFTILKTAYKPSTTASVE